MPIQSTVSVGCQPPSSGSFQFHFHNFANLSGRPRKNHYIKSPEFTCNGHQWELWVYPGGSFEAGEGQVSIFLTHLSHHETITTSCEIKVIDKFGKTRADFISEKYEFSSNIKCLQLTDFISRSDILDESKNILDSNGTLTVVVNMEEHSTSVFVPQNPLVKIMKKMFNDETSADVCFEVITGGENDDENDRNKRAKTTTSFYAHRFILENCAPMLAAICESNDSGAVVKASVNDIKPEIFHHLLFYVYGGSIPEEDLKSHAKDIIDAADKYSIVNLKLAAEAAYVQLTEISLENAMVNLLYADSRNLALLKEAIMDFLADNHYAAADQISFTDFPGHVVKDLLVAFGKSRKKDTKKNWIAPCVSALRRKLDEMGLEVDGSREAMIESIKNHWGEANFYHQDFE